MVQAHLLAVVDRHPGVHEYIVKALAQQDIAVPKDWLEEPEPHALDIFGLKTAERTAQILLDVARKKHQQQDSE